MLRPWATTDYLTFCLAAVRIGAEVDAEVDAELGRLMLAAARDDSLWPAVYDRLLACGRLDEAERLRRAVAGE